MSVLIDPPLWPAHGRLWSHLVSDASLEELHTFAEAAGVPERGFEGDHYDVPDERYAELVRAGANPVSTRELLRRLQGSGLRRPKRRGERVLASAEADGGIRVDTVRSSLSPPMPAVRAYLLVQAGQSVLASASDGRLPRAEGNEDDVLAARLRLAGLIAVDLAEVLWTRLGYLRESRPPQNGRGPFTYESLVQIQLGRGLTSGVAAPRPGDWRWVQAADVIAAEAAALGPLLGLAL